MSDEKPSESNVQADNNSTAVGSIAIDGSNTGNINIGGNQTITTNNTTTNVTYNFPPSLESDKSPEFLNAAINIQYFEPETILIPEGPVWMDSHQVEGIPSHETSKNDVVLPAYRIGKYLVTNDQYKMFLKQTDKLATPSMGWEGQRVPKDLEKEPVTGVTWYEALSYCNWLNEKTKRSYTLPTEAEWEKACQSGEFSSFEFACHIRQWTRTLWGEDSITPDPQFAHPYNDQSNDLAASSIVRRLIRGGVVPDSDKKSGCSVRSSNAPDRPGPPGKRIGFRVVLKSSSS